MAVNLGVLLVPVITARRVCTPCSRAGSSQARTGQLFSFPSSSGCFCSDLCGEDWEETGEAAEKPNTKTTLSMIINFGEGDIRVRLSVYKDIRVNRGFAENSRDWPPRP